MDETDDAAHLQSMLEDFSDGELVEDLLPRSPPRSSEVGNTAVKETDQRVSDQEVTLFIGNLSPVVTEKLLEKLFSEFGPIRSSKIIQSSPVYRFAFLSYYQHCDANAARFTMDGKNYLGSKLMVKWRVRKTNAPASKENFHVFVGDLDKDVDTNDLRDAFAPFGEMTACTIITDAESFLSKGFGFVSYTNEEDAVMAIETMQGQWLKNKIIRTGWAIRRENRRRVFEKNHILCMKDAPMYESYIHCQQSYDHIFNQASMTNRSIYVGGLSQSNLNKNTLQIGFEPFGQIEEITLRNAYCAEKSGYAFILYSTKESACNAILCMHNKTFNGTPIKVFWAKERCEPENEHENYYETLTRTFEYGQPIEEIKRTVQEYGCGPGFGPESGPPPIMPISVPGVPLQVPQPVFTQSFEQRLPPQTVTENDCPPPAPPEEESGYHAFSYYGTYVYQEKIATEEGRTSSSISPLKDTTRPAPSPPRTPPKPKERLKSVAAIKIHRKDAVNVSQQEGLKGPNKSRSRSQSKKRKPSPKKYETSSSSSRSRSRSRTRSRTRSRSRSRTRCRTRSRTRSRCRRSRSRSLSWRRSGSRSSRNYDSDSDRVRYRPVKSRVVSVTKRRKDRVPFTLPSHHIPPAPAFNHNIHAINQSTIVTFPSIPVPSNYQHHSYPSNFQEGHLPNVYPAFPAPISCGPQPSTFANPALQAPAGLTGHPQSHQYYVNPHFVNQNLGIITSPQEYSQSYPYPNPQHNFPSNYIYQPQFNESNPNYVGEQHQPLPVYDSNYYQLQPGPRFSNVTYYPK